MARTVTVHVRVEPELKREAEEAFSALGLSVSEAVTLFYEEVAAHGRLPFPTRVPNATTLEAIRQIRTGEDLTEYASLDELMAELGEADSEEG